MKRCTFVFRVVLVMSACFSLGFKISHPLSQQVNAVASSDDKREGAAICVHPVHATHSRHVISNILESRSRAGAKPKQPPSQDLGPDLLRQGHAYVCSWTAAIHVLELNNFQTSTIENVHDLKFVDVSDPIKHIETPQEQISTL